MAFAREKHIKFWRMNATLLPHHYTSSDSSRMTLGYFIVAALDLLSALGGDDDSNIIKDDERQGWIDWIYACQCPEGGFRGFTGNILNDGARNEANAVWDPPNVPATFFALTALLVLRDDLEGVKRKECLAWLPRVQRADGSFGELLGDDGVRIEGGRDLRFCCCAAGVAYILQGVGSERNGTTTIDVDAMVGYVRSCRNYNGGFGESPFKEPHSGLTYCAVAALAFAQKLEAGKDRLSVSEPAIRWMLERQTDVLEEEEEEEVDEENSNNDQRNDQSNDQAQNPEHLFAGSKGPIQSSIFKIPTIAGFNGREGKIADTCYCLWNTGALAILNSTDLIDSDAMRKYLLEETQHMIGGFGKGPGAPPDVMHSYLGLAALSLVGEKGLKPLDPGLCISREAADRVNTLRWKKSAI